MSRSWLLDALDGIAFRRGRSDRHQVTRPDLSDDPGGLGEALREAVLEGVVAGLGQLRVMLSLDLESAVRFLDLLTHGDFFLLGNATPNRVNGLYSPVLGISGADANDELPCSPAYRGAKRHPCHDVARTSGQSM
jgi:hypothetical protein